MLERKRDDIVRSSVLQIHTAIEDLLNLHIINEMLGATPQTRGSKLRTNAGQALRRLLYGGGSIGFDRKLNLAVTLGIMTPGRRVQLMELNTMRNKCSHNWLLRAPNSLIGKNKLLDMALLGNIELVLFRLVDRFYFVVSYTDASLDVVAC